MTEPFWRQKKAAPVFATDFRPRIKRWLLHIKAVSHVINSRALIGEKSCNNKAIHALLMHGYATFNMIVPGPQIRCRYGMYTARP